MGTVPVGLFYRQLVSRVRTTAGQESPGVGGCGRLALTSARADAQRPSGGSEGPRRWAGWARTSSGWARDAGVPVTRDGVDFKRRRFMKACATRGLETASTYRPAELVIRCPTKINQVHRTAPLLSHRNQAETTVLADSPCRQSPNTDLPVMVTNFAARPRIAAASLKAGSLSKASLAAASLNQVTTI